MKRVVVIGGGAAGMMAAYACATKGHTVYLLEKNEKLGKKIYITGKGRCNLTNDCDVEDLFKSILRNPKFLYSAIYTFDNYQVQQFFTEHGCPVKVERGGRVFPVSDHASDVIRALETALRELGVHIQLHTKVTKIESDGTRIRGVRFIKNH
ncbi:MAG: FAD-dependent oxidoreductase, partial [Lachnospiraceae bacterium]|nr:FAD-dependent oxidoreductase [Lachnospiraceae bacterium]